MQSLTNRVASHVRISVCEVGSAVGSIQPTSQCPFSITSRPSAVIRPCVLVSTIKSQCKAELLTPAGLGVALAERQVDGPPDLFVVEDTPGEAIDAAIEPEPQLAQPPGAGVEIEHRQQVIFTLSGLCFDDLPLVKLEADSDQLAAIAADGETAAQAAGGGIFDGPGEDLAGGHVPLAVRVDPGAPGDREGQVGVRRPRSGSIGRPT